MKSIMLFVVLTPLLLMASQRTLQYRGGKDRSNFP